MKKYILIFLLLIPFAHSLGLGNSLNNNVLYLDKGESYLLPISVQKSENYVLDLEFTWRSNITELLDEANFTLGSDDHERILWLNITMPPNATAKDSYEILYSVKPRITDQGGVPILVRISDSITVRLHEYKAPPEKKTNIFMFILVIIISIGLILLIYNRSRKLSSKFIR